PLLFLHSFPTRRSSDLLQWRSCRTVSRRFLLSRAPVASIASTAARKLPFRTDEFPCAAAHHPTATPLAGLFSRVRRSRGDRGIPADRESPIRFRASGDAAIAS